MTLREQILAQPKAASGAVAAVPTPEWPDVGQVYVRIVSAEEYDRLWDSDAKGNHRGRAVCLFAADAAGNRLFSDADAVAVGKLPLSVINRIYAAGVEHNGLNETREVLEKNSAVTADAGSPSS